MRTLVCAGIKRHKLAHTFYKMPHVQTGVRAFLRVQKTRAYNAVDILVRFRCVVQCFYGPIICAACIVWRVLYMCLACACVLCVIVHVCARRLCETMRPPRQTSSTQNVVQLCAFKNKITTWRLQLNWTKCIEDLMD